MTPLTVADVIKRLRFGGYRILNKELPAPSYTPSISAEYLSEDHPRLGLAVESMKDHATNEGWELFKGLEEGGGYLLAGEGLTTLFRGTNFSPSFVGQNLTDLTWLVRCDPSTIVIQDKREWKGLTAERRRDPSIEFKNVDILRDRPDIFRVTIVKDAQNDQALHRQAAEEIGCHAWIHYYHPTIVKYLAPYVRPQHLVRTYHTVNKDDIPHFVEAKDRSNCIVSGAISGAYPLRTRMFQNQGVFQGTTFLNHPGYHQRGSNTPEYLRILSRFKVSVCTASIYGYSLRKLVESSACGCRVLTDLPSDEILPDIDSNLIRVHSDTPLEEIASIIKELVATYDQEKQEHVAELAKKRYDYRAEGKRLADSIELLRYNYDAKKRSL